MKLLVDENLSPKLARRLGDLFPGSSHVSLVGLDAEPDAEVWEYAAANGFTILTKDDDYNDLSVLRGCPPKLLWLTIGNCTTDEVEELIRTRVAEISEFESDLTAAVLVLG